MRLYQRGYTKSGIAYRCRLTTEQVVAVLARAGITYESRYDRQQGHLARATSCCLDCHRHVTARERAAESLVPTPEFCGWCSRPRTAAAQAMAPPDGWVQALNLPQRECAATRATVYAE